MAHPRSRGENRAPAAQDEPAHGSSPLTRGKPLSDFEGCLYDRLIPAHAGKTQVCPFQAALMPAHPRSRGENYPKMPRDRLPQGSSPLTPGKLSTR